MSFGESNCGESVGLFNRLPSYIIPSESVSESCNGIYNVPIKLMSSNYPDTPRIRQLKRELAELENELKSLEKKAELDLEQQIKEAKQKVKKYKM